MFSLWVGFKGGKGMATSAGAFLAMAPTAVLINFGIWLAITFGTGLRLARIDRGGPRAASAHRGDPAPGR